MLQLHHNGLAEVLQILVVRHERQVQRNSNQVTLRAVVALVVVPVDDELLAIFLRRTHVLECLKIKRVGQNVVAVDALEDFVLVRLAVLELLKAAIRHDLDAA